ncbi:MAG TPA: Flp pilus assembly protein CpaB [Candidatus Acidoferrales bacterium]
MNRTRLLVGLVGAIVIAFFLSFFVYRQLKSAAVRPPATRTIVVAAEPLQVGARVDANNLRLMPWPGDQPVAGMFTRIQDCANRALITPVVENEPILDSKLAPVAAGAGLPATIPEGMRAVSVAVNDVVGVAGFVIPGTMVDVLVTGQTGTGGPNGSENITRTILENVRVLAAGQKTGQDREGKPQTVPVITLLVSPGDAAKLTMASTEGKIQLALRNTVDAKDVDPPPVMQATLFSGGAPPPQIEHKVVRVARAAPPAPYAVEVITGDKRTMKTFENQ